MGIDWSSVLLQMSFPMGVALITLIFFLWLSNHK